MTRSHSSTPTRLAFLGALLLGCGPSGGNPTTTTQGGCEGEGCACGADSECGDGLACVDGVCGTPESTTSTSEGTSSSSTTAGPTTSSSSTTQTSDETTTGCNFVCPTTTGGSMCDVLPDDPVLRIQCDVFAQDCDDGQKCAAWDADCDGSWDSTKCVEVMGDGQHGDPCTAEEGTPTGVDDCAEGVMCWNLNEENVGTCVELCTGTQENPQCGPPNTSCVIANMGVLNLCLPGCDPLLQDCMNDEVCIGDPMGDGFVCVLDASGGMAPAGTPCEFANVCNPGLFCANTTFYTDPNCADAIGCCAPFCDLQNGNADCAGLLNGMAECVAWYEMGMGPPQYMHVGGCGIPS